MKNMLLVVLVSVFVGGCGKNEKKSQLLTGLSSTDLAPHGTITFYSGESGINTNSSFRKLATRGLGIVSYLTISSIEISTTGEEWVTVLNGPIEVEVDRNQNIKIANSISIPVGQYHGIKLNIEPKVRFETVKNGVELTDASVATNTTVEKLPCEFVIGNHALTSTESIVFSSANGFLVPFDIEENAGTFLIFEFRVDWRGADVNNINDWELWIPGARATRFLY